MTTSMAVRTATRTLSSAQLQRAASALLRSAASRQLASCRTAPAVISRSSSDQRAVSRALSGSVAASFDVKTLLRGSSVLGIRNASDAAEETVNVPGMGDSISEGSIATWNKKVGEYVEADEVIAVVDTDKVSVDILCPVSGVLQKVEANEGDTVFVGDPFYTILVTDDRSLASGPSDNAGDDAADETEESAGSPANARKETVVPMSRMRQSIAKRLKGAQEDAAALSTFNEVDMSGLMALRSELGEAFKATHGCKLGFMSPFIIACAKALQRFPDVNASIMNKKEIEYRNYVDISVAVATPTGLMVPVIRDCHTKSFADLEKELLELAGRAREGQIKMDEMAGGTFTISNGGIYGSMMGTPLLNPPQSAILGMHTITPRPVAVKGKIEIRPMMYLALTYDHQIVDGREAVSFLKMVKELLEDPRRMLLEV